EIATDRCGPSVQSQTSKWQKRNVAGQDQKAPLSFSVPISRPVPDSKSIRGCRAIASSFEPVLLQIRADDVAFNFNPALHCSEADSLGGFWDGLDSRNGLAAQRHSERLAILLHLLEK